MTEHDTSAHDDHGHHGNLGLFTTIFIALCVLTALSFASFHAFHSTPKVSWLVMMAISCVKAMLVILFFMHLKWEANWKYVLTFPALLMSFFLLVMLIPDVGWRGDHISRERALHMAVPAVHGKAHGHDEAEQGHEGHGNTHPEEQHHDAHEESAH